MPLPLGSGIGLMTRRMPMLAADSRPSGATAQRFECCVRHYVAERLLALQQRKRQASNTTSCRRTEVALSQLAALMPSAGTLKNSSDQCACRSAGLCIQNET